MLQHFKRLAGQIIFYGLSDTVNRLIAVLILPLFTRFLSPSDYGVASILIVTSSFIISFADFGLVASIIRFYRDADEKKRQQIIATAQLVMVFSVSIIAAIALPFSRQISEFFFKTPDYSYIVALNFLTIPLTKLVTAPMTMFRVKEKAKAFAFWEILQVTGGILINLFLIVGLKRGVNGLFEGPFINAAIFAVILGIYSFKVNGFNYSWSLFKQMLGFGSPLIINAVSMWIINWADRVILSRLVSLSEVGLYTLGYSIGMAIALPVTAFTAAWPPFYMSVAKEPDVKKIYALIFTFYTLVISFFVLAVGTFGRDYFLFFTPEKFHGAIVVIPIVALAYAFRGNFSIVAAGAYLVKKTYLVTVVEVIAMAVNIGLVYLLVPLMGRVGAAWATAVSFALLPILMLILTRKAYPFYLEYRRIILIILISVFFYFLISFIYQPTIINLLLRTALLLIYPVLFWLVGFFTPQEKDHLLKLLSKIRFKKQDVSEKGLSE